MDKEQIKKALDAFEDERYSDAKDILKKEIETAKKDFIKDKLDIDLDKDKAADDPDKDDDGGKETPGQDQDKEPDNKDEEE